MTNRKEYDIIVKHSEKRVQNRAKEDEKANFFKKICKKYLTSSKNCDIMIELSEIGVFAKARADLIGNSELNPNGSTRKQHEVLF